MDKNYICEISQKTLFCVKWTILAWLCPKIMQAYTCHDPKMAHLHNSGYAIKIFLK